MNRPICRATRCLPSRGPDTRRAARRRCSRSATSRSCAIEPPPMSLPASDIGRPCPISPRPRGAVLEQTGLLPHLNPGHLTASDVAALRAVSLSQGLMLESASERLCERGGPHHGSPDKHPQARLASIRAAGRAARAVHLGHSDRHRRNARGADRFAACPARAQRRLRAHPGNHHPEFPAETRNPHGRLARAAASRNICGRSRSRDCCLRRR